MFDIMVVDIILHCLKTTLFGMSIYKESRNKYIGSNSPHISELNTKSFRVSDLFQFLTLLTSRVLFSSAVEGRKYSLLGTRV